MADAENKRKFMQLLRLGVQDKIRALQLIKILFTEDEVNTDIGLKAQLADGDRQTLLPSCGTKLAEVAAWQTLAWRDAFSMAPYFLEVINNKPLRIKQVLQGELNGFGTGLTVWPAACVLIKYLEYQSAHTVKELVNSDNPFLLELGSGTGAVGISAAMLLQAGRVVLTDLDNVRFIMEANVALAQQDEAVNKHVTLQVDTYEWGLLPSENLILPSENVYPDLILVSDCILPRLYPIEPLVEALTKLSRSHTRIIISYECRHFQHFDPKQRFWELMEAKNFLLREIDTNEYHPQFIAADIEVWEIINSSERNL
ncbi:uncharacterized protein CCR75_000499 [Bremia lactucae]|uniref:Uncharacterized protein n=1 Tax=Bremia lactucae TaxID=4779 RepID=A0A976FP84_BRELC|nr:hypothetical protein CCR75_000499 [Bremia lactucae]